MKNPFRVFRTHVLDKLLVIKRGLEMVMLLPKLQRLHGEVGQEAATLHASLYDRILENQELFFHKNEKPLYFEAIFLEAFAAQIGVNFVDEPILVERCENIIRKIENHLLVERKYFRNNLDIELKLRTMIIHLHGTILRIRSRQSFVDPAIMNAGSLVETLNGIMSEVEAAPISRLSQRDRDVLKILCLAAKTDVIKACHLSFPPDDRPRYIGEAIEAFNGLRSQEMVKRLPGSTATLDIYKHSLSYIFAINSEAHEDDLLSLASEMQGTLENGEHLTPLSIHETQDAMAQVWGRLWELSGNAKYLKLAKEAMLNLDDAGLATPQSRLRILSTNVQLTMDQGDFQSAYDLLEPFILSPTDWLSRKFEHSEVEHFMTAANEFGALAAHCKLMMGDAVGALGCLEAASSIAWKIRASEELERVPIGLGNVGFNSEIENRVNVRIGVTRYGLSLICFGVRNGRRFAAARLVESFDVKRFIYWILNDLEFPEHTMRYKFAIDNADPSDWTRVQDTWDWVIAELLSHCWHSVGVHIHSLLDQCKVQDGTFVHLICPSSLSSFPIPNCGHQLEDGSWRCLNDRWFISMSEFAGHQQFIGKSGSSDNCGNTVWVADPRLDLAVTASTIWNEIGEGAEVLWGSEADTDAALGALRHSSFVGFICHSEWVFFDLRASGLHLAGGEVLRPSDLSPGELRNNPVIFLGSCETKLGDLLFQTNESRGLSDSFLWAGASLVTAAHWPISVETAICYGKVASLGASMRPESKTLIAITQFQRMARSRRGAEHSVGTNEGASIHTDGLWRPSVWAAYTVTSR